MGVFFYRRKTGKLFAYLNSVEISVKVLFKWSIRFILLLVSVGGIAATWGYWELKASLPVLDGRIALPNLSGEVSVERDSLGMATISAKSRIDVARAMGFLHGQERFFQMDLMRRRAAGELSALVGLAALDLDKRVRVHQLRLRSQAIVERFTQAEKSILYAYVDGVNEGLHRLGSKPFEYWLLRTTPEDWRAEDAVLTAYSMYLVLQASTPEKELTRLKVKNLTPSSLYAFLRAPGTQWDAPLWGEPLLPTPIPSEDSLGGWRAHVDVPLKRSEGIEPAFPGSNSWAVAGSLSKTGSAILQNDMHLGLQVPNIWFRAQIRFGANHEHQVTGVSLPGTPLIIAGSNGHIAWGYTNSYGDFSDVIAIEQSTPGTYLTPNGEREFDIANEIIRVKGKEDEKLSIENTEWGPVVETASDGRKYVFKWLAHDVAQTLNLGVMHLETTESVVEAIGVAHDARLPSQNFLVVDKEGNLAWTIIGAIPKRTSCSGDEPQNFGDGQCAWEGYFAASEYPLVMNPAQGRLWTANNRIASGEMLKRLGDGGYDLGARAKQIRDGLFAHEKFDEKMLLDIALDDRGLLLAPWKQHLETLLNANAADSSPLLTELLAQLKSEKELYAREKSVAYRVVRAYRYLLRDVLYQAWLADAYAAQPDLKIGSLSNQWEGVIWQVIQQRPIHLLPKPYTSWQSLELDVLKTTLESLQIQDTKALANVTWGARNQAAIRHPLSRFVPLLGKYLDAPRESLDGDANMPRVAAPTFGSSERMVVSPGHEENAIFHMPGGQSGHPLSPFYLAGHEAWVKGEPTPFLPQKTEHQFKLVPQSTH